MCIRDRVYSMLDIPEDCYSPLFAASRMVGWLAHNIENKLYCDKIVRPAGKMCIRDRFDDQDRRDGFHFLPANGQTPDRLRRSLKTARRQTCWPSPPGLQRRESGNPPDSCLLYTSPATAQHRESENAVYLLWREEAVTFQNDGLRWKS